MNFTNPRTHAIVPDWPLGGSRRGPAVFTVESNKRGERISRVTTGRPKHSTYGANARIVDGDDGKIYLLFVTEFLQVRAVPGTMTGDTFLYDGDSGYWPALRMLNPTLAEKMWASLQSRGELKGDPGHVE